MNFLKKTLFVFFVLAIVLAGTAFIRVYATAEGVTEDTQSIVAVAKNSVEYDDDGMPVKEGYVFAGWYKDEALTEPYLQALTSEDTGYAKFVPADVLTVKAQLSADAASYIPTVSAASLRFVTTVNCLQYRSVGFLFQVGGNSKETSSNTVYSRLYAVGSDGVVDTILPTSFSSVSNFFMAYTLKEIPDEAWDTGITVTPYWVTLDGTKVYGTEATKTVNLGRITDEIAARIGNNLYTTPKAAVDAANDQGGTEAVEAVVITVPRDATMRVSGSATLTVNNSTIDGSGNYGIHTFLGADVKLNNSNVLNSGSHNLFIEINSTCTLEGTSLISSSRYRSAYVGGNLIMNNGSICNNTINGNGAAIYVDTTGAFTLNGGSVCNNTATSLGGAIYSAGNVTINGGELYGNTAGQGGAIYSDAAGSITIKDGTFSGNTANSSPESGGAINLFNTTAQISGGTFKENIAACRGGAINCNGGTLDITGGTFTGNVSRNQGGGAISVVNTTANISGVTMQGNICPATTSANYMGGGALLVQENTTVTLGDCLINGNRMAGTDAEAGFDIGFRGQNNAKLILADNTFDGRIACVFGITAVTVTVDGTDVSVPVTAGTVYSVDYTNKKLVKVQ